MKIFFTGAQGTGKSTLIKNLDGFDDYIVNDSAPGKFMKSKSDQKNSLDFQKKILAYQVGLWVSTENFISSRSIFDMMSYMVYFWNIYEKPISTLYNWAREYISILTEDNCYYFYLPIEFNINEKNNKNRIVDKQYQKNVDIIIQDHLKVWDTPNLYTLSGDISERINKIKEVLNNGN